MLWLAFSSYSYSEVILGQTNNAAANGYQWVMENILPDQAGLTIDGVYHRYTLSKPAETDGSVIIRNENANGTGYIYERTDNWNGLAGNTKVGYDALASLPGDHFGTGEILVEGDGTLSDVNITYGYSFDTCAEPLKDPRCPGYETALYKYLIDNNLLNEPDWNDPYYNEYVQKVLDDEGIVVEEPTEEEVAEEEEKEEESLEDKLAVGGAAEKLSNAAQQQAMLVAMASAATMNSYYNVTIPGGSYTESVVLQDKNLPDNGKALRNLASDGLHREMVRSQYDK